MKKVMYSFMIGFVILSLGNSTIVAVKDTTALNASFSMLEQQEDVVIDYWALVGREQLTSIHTEQDFSEELERVKEIVRDFEWEIDVTGTNQVATGTRKQAGLEETVKIASTLVKGQPSYLTYEIKGTETSQYTDELMVDRKESLFRRKPTFFTCIKGHFSDNMDTVLATKMNQWMKAFQATEVESLREDGFLSVTAESPLFESNYISEDYNLQLAMRYDGMGSKTSFVIGTPILIFEY
ncbi:MAG: YwmB family TATA-box binding protein [Bacillus sp. (in: firmicutes)]